MERQLVAFMNISIASLKSLVFVLGKSLDEKSSFIC